LQSQEGWVRGSRSLSLLLTSVSCLLSSVCSSPALEAAEQLQFADGLYARGMYDTAVKEYQSFLVQNPGRQAEAPAVYYRLGESFIALGRTNEADRAYQQAYEATPDGEFHYRAGLRRADLLEQAGNREGQLQILNSMLTGSPAPELGAACRYAVGVALEKQGNTRDASVAYEAVLDQYPKTAYVSYAALALAGLDRKAGGTRCADLYRRAAAHAGSPRVGAEAWFQLGDFLFSRKDYETSAEAYEKLASLYPKDVRVAQAQLQRAWALYYAKRYADALEVCAASLASGGQGASGPEWLYLKANSQRQVMKNTEALATYADLLKTYPESPFTGSAAYERALALFKLGRFQEAIDQARGLLSNDRVKRDVCWLLAESCAAVRDEAGAVQYYRMLTEQYPDSPLAGDALYRLANLLQKKGDFLQAAELFGRLAGDFPAHELAAQSVFAQASCFGKALKHEQAVAAYTRLLAKYPACSYIEDSLYQKATVETFLRRDAGALETWGALLTRFPATKYAADARFWNGVLLEENGRLEEAETAFRAALKSAPVPSDDLARRIRFRLALVLQRGGTKDASAERLDEAAALLQDLMDTPLRDKFPPPLLEWLGESQLGRRDFAKAGKVAELMVSAAATDNWKQIAWCLKGKAFMGQGKRDEARQAFERVVGFSLKSQAMAEAWLKLGELSLADDPAKAKRAYEEAATLAASDALLSIRVQAYAGIARALKAQGDQAGAARHFLSVAVLFDDPALVPECLYEAASAFTAAGRKDDADKAKKELRERYPDSEWARTIK